MLILFVLSLEWKVVFRKVFGRSRRLVLLSRLVCLLSIGLVCLIASIRLLVESSLAAALWLDSVSCL